MKIITGTCAAYDPYFMIDLVKVDWLDSWMKVYKSLIISYMYFSGYRYTI